MSTALVRERPVVTTVRTARVRARRRGAVAVVLLAALPCGALVLTQGHLRGAAADLTGTAPEGVGDTQGLQPAVLRAFDRAAAAAAADGVELRITSGWRSAEHQQQLYEAAVAKYGSPERARRWVLPPAESEHVQGLAIDVGPREGASWLAHNGVRFGLCRRYDNEPWHFERLAPAKGSVCPLREPHA